MWRTLMKVNVLWDAYPPCQLMLFLFQNLPEQHRDFQSVEGSRASSLQPVWHFWQLQSMRAFFLKRLISKAVLLNIEFLERVSSPSVKGVKKEIIVSTLTPSSTILLWCYMFWLPILFLDVFTPFSSFWFLLFIVSTFFICPHWSLFSSYFPFLLLFPLFLFSCLLDSTSIFSHLYIPPTHFSFS